MIRALVILDDSLGIAASGTIPWRIPEDMRRFRQLTEHAVVLMGRKTYDTLAEPLPNRRNVVASRSLQTVRPGFALLQQDVRDFLHNASEDIWLIGGGELALNTLLLCDELYLTHVKGDFHCDTFFPKFVGTFELVEQSEWQQSGTLTYRFELYKKPVGPEAHR